MHCYKQWQIAAALFHDKVAWHEACTFIWLNLMKYKKKNIFIIISGCIASCKHDLSEFTSWQY